VVTLELLVPTYKASTGNNMEDVLEAQDEYYSNMEDAHAATLRKTHIYA
jgi:hypothetical protein